jgi:hypothetical protein
MSKAIRHALTIANFTIDQPAPLGSIVKLRQWGGVILIVSKNRPLFVQRLSVFLFFRELRKIKPPARKKKLEENSGPDPLLTTNLEGCHRESKEVSP